MDDKERRTITYKLAETALKEIDSHLEGGWRTKREYKELLEYLEGVLTDIKAATDPNWHPDPPAKPKPQRDKWGI